MDANLSQNGSVKRSYHRLFNDFWFNHRDLGDQGKLLLLYLFSNRHSNMLGLYHLPLEYVVSDMGWSKRTVCKHLGSLIKKKVVMYDNCTLALFLRRQ